MQVFPNFVNPDATANGRAPIQALTSTPYILTDTDVTNGYASIPITFEKAFADSNYVVSMTVERTPASNVPANSIAPAQITSKTASGFTANLALITADLGSGGQTVLIHVVAFHA
jgi:hypothetical protein